MSIDRFMDLFQGRADTFAQQHSDGSYTPVRRPITREDYIAHGKGEVTYGIYTVRPDNTTKFIVWDIDMMSQHPIDAIFMALTGLGVPDAINRALVEFSGKKGHHVWLPFEEWMPATLAYRAGRAVMQKAGLDVECFPKQESVGEGFGNLVKLPMGKHQVSGEWSRWVESFIHWTEVEPISAAQLSDLSDQYRQPARSERPPFRVNSSMPGSTGLPPCMQRVLQDGVGEGKRDLALFSLAVESKRRGKDESEAFDLALDANSKFEPPLDQHVVRQKVRSAYSKQYAGIKCEMEWLHEREETLCSKACPRYSPSFGMARDDGRPVEPSAGRPRFITGEVVELVVESSYTRGDGRVVYVLSHPSFTNNPIGVV